jgi:hypothetical protein
LLTTLLTESRVRFIQEASAAEGLAHVGQLPPVATVPVAELAAWTAVSRAILNLHETISRN